MNNYDISAYNSTSKLYNCDSDGYLWVNMNGTTIDVTVNIYAKDRATFTYNTFLANSGVRSLYVKKGAALCYISGTPTAIRFVKFTY